MTTKNYGAGASGYLDPEGRGWETTVYQAGKPILDKELNLIQDAEQDVLLKFQRRSFPSGWVSDNFLNSTTSEVFNAVVNTANLLQTKLFWAQVNGWMLKITNTNNNTGLNNIDLGTAPAGAGAKRTDLVILEVWRRLIPASPTTTGKSPAGRIWQNGNVKIASGDDLTLNFADDILDGAVGAETTKRVQIQYRLRVIHGVDLFTYPFGITDPTVVANSVPASAAAPDGVATILTYTNQSANGDSGLWRAGDGNPANALGTVDGYIYALPLAAVFRRNSTAFARNTNHNGGVAFGGSSDRPDGLFYNITVARDVLDLRAGTAPTGWDFQEVVQKNMNFLFDNVNQTEIGETTIGGGVDGHTVLWADEIGVSNANGGDGTTTGDTPGAEFIGEFDAVRRTFSDKVIYETIVLRYVPADGSGGGPNWNVGDVITITPSALPIWPFSAQNWAAHAPSAVSFVDIVGVTFIGESGGSTTVDVSSTGWSVTGLGTAPQGSASLKLLTVSGSAPVYVKIVVAYPSGVGLTKTPTNTYAQGVQINNPGQLPAGAPILYSALKPPTYSTPNREVTLTYQTVSHTRNYFTTSATSTLFMPERIDPTLPLPTLTINAAPYVGAMSIGTDGYTINIAGGSITGGETIVITHQSVRPLPQNNEQLTVYYEAREPQTVRAAVLGTSLSLIPKYVSPHMFILTSGSGSDGQAYPFPFQYVQTGGVYPGSGGTFAGDHELDGDLRVTLTTLYTETGFMQLGCHIPVVPSPDDLTLARAGGDVDIEGRTFFKQVSSAYQPMAVADTLSDPKKHKNVLPILAELSADGPFGFKGQLVLVLLSRWAIFDDSNSVSFATSLVTNTTTASVYRLKGNLLNNRRS